MTTRGYRWPRYARRIYRRVPHYADAPARTLTRALGAGAAGPERAPRRRTALRWRRA